MTTCSEYTWTHARDVAKHDHHMQSFLFAPFPFSIFVFLFCNWMFLLLIWFHSWLVERTEGRPCWSLKNKNFILLTASCSLPFPVSCLHHKNFLSRIVKIYCTTNAGFFFYDRLIFYVIRVQLFILARWVHEPLCSSKLVGIFKFNPLRDAGSVIVRRSGQF